MASIGHFAAVPFKFAWNVLPGNAVVKGAITAGAALLGLNAMRGLRTANLPYDGAYTSAGPGLGGVGGSDITRNGTLADPGFALLHFPTALKNTAWAIADKVTGNNKRVEKARLQATTKSGLDIGATIAKGGYDKSFASPLIGDVIGGTLSPEERAMINMMEPKDQARYLLQKKMQEKAEMAALCSQLQGLRHSVAMQVIGNIR